MGRGVAGGGRSAISRDEALRTIEVIHECMEEGLPLDPVGPQPGARSEAARRLRISRPSLTNRLDSAARHYDLHVDAARFCAKDVPPLFSVDNLPGDGEPDPGALISALAARHRERKAYHDAKALRDVQVHMDGPIAVAFFGDPHVDDPGCAWGDLERDVSICRDTVGMMAVDVGDNSNNWVGRLMRLYADQEVTSKQALTLIEWLMTALPWLLWEDGNHDCHDMETEALTRRGWVPGAAVVADDEVLSLDVETGQAVWTGIDQRIRRANTDSMISIDRSPISLNVTPNHRVLHRKRRSLDGAFGPLEYAQADSLPHRFAIPLSAVGGQPDHPLTDSQIALVGWFLTDGGVYQTRGYTRVTFYQSKVATGLEAALAGSGYTPRVTERRRATAAICGRSLKAPPRPSREYHLRAEDSRAFMAIAERKGAVPTWVEHLSERQFDVFLRAVIAGDGSWATGGGDSAVIHGTKAFLDSLQAACVQHGWSAHLSMVRGKDWRLNVCRRLEWQGEKADSVTRSPASSEVWCLRVPHGNFMVRRRGKAHFSGNSWNTDKGDPTQVMHRLLGRVGVMNTGGTRMRLTLPAGAAFTMHVRHDFPGGSQFNPAHALVRETLFGYRDHILACGHRHVSGYIPVWHNDPKRLCHGLRLGTYKDFDKYAAEKGFQDGNWARSMAVVVDPDHAADPVRFIKAFFSLQEAAEYLTWRRGRWDLGRSAA